MKFTKTYAKMAVVLLCSAVIFTGCKKAEDVVLTLNDKPITRAEFYNDFEKIKNAQFKDAPREQKKDTSYNVLSLKERYLNEFITRKLVELEFEKRNITASEDEIQKRKQEIIQQIGSEEQFQNIMKENNITEEKFMSDVASEVKMKKLIDTIKGKEATEADALKFYNQNKAQFAVPERVLASHIFIGADPQHIRDVIAEANKGANLSQEDMDKKVQEELKRREQLANKIWNDVKKNPKLYNEYAKKYSEDDTTKNKGGEIGYVTKDSLIKEFADVAFSIKPNTIGPLAHSQYGYHIIKIKDKAAPTTQSFASVKKDLITMLTQQSRQQEIQNFFEGLKNSAKIEYPDESLNPDNLKKALDEALKKQVDFEQRQKAPKSKMKFLDNLKNKQTQEDMDE